jgi:tRNA pseudouridine55 synthase
MIRHPMDGTLNLYKPIGISSARALHRVRKLLGQRKSGHAGTLDPLADGVLLVCLGRATRLVEQLMDQPKVYRAVAALDATSASFDAETPAVAVPVERPPDLERVAAVLHAFEGPGQQVPPASSAVKVSGRPAYKLSRAGKPPRLAARPIQVYWLHVHRYAWPRLDFELACGRGTYIRALVRDLGLALGTGGTLTSLTRRAVGPFHSAESWSLERLAAADPAQAVIPLEQAREMLAVRPIQIPPRPDSHEADY